MMRYFSIDGLWSVVVRVCVCVSFHKNHVALPLEAIEDGRLCWVKLPSCLHGQGVVALGWLLPLQRGGGDPFRQLWVLHDQPLLLHLLQGVVRVHVQGRVILVDGDLRFAHCREVGWNGEEACMQK